MSPWHARERDPLSSVVSFCKCIGMMEKKLEPERSCSSAIACHDPRWLLFESLPAVRPAKVSRGGRVQIPMDEGVHGGPE